MKETGDNRRTGGGVGREALIEFRFREASFVSGS